jgi:hypothetical protein
MIFDKKTLYKVVDVLIVSIIGFYMIARQQYSDQNCYLSKYTNGTVSDKTLYNIMIEDCAVIQQANSTLYDFINSEYGRCDPDNFHYHYTVDTFGLVIYICGILAVILGKTVHTKTEDQWKQDFFLSFSNRQKQLKVFRIYALLRIVYYCLCCFHLFESDLRQDATWDNIKELLEKMDKPDPTEDKHSLKKDIDKAYRYLVRFYFLIYLLLLLAVVVTLFVHRENITSYQNSPICELPRYARSSITAFAITSTILYTCLLISLI